MTPEDLLDGLRKRGVTVAREGDDLILDEAAEAPEVLTKRLLAAIRKHKPALLALLAHEDNHRLSCQTPAPRTSSSPWSGHAPLDEGGTLDWEREERELRECALLEREPEYEPPDPEPYHPSWGDTRARWDAHLGLWLRVGILVTEATRENYARYYAQKRARLEVQQAQAREQAPVKSASALSEQQVLAPDAHQAQLPQLA